MKHVQNQFARYNAAHKGASLRASCHRLRWRIGVLGYVFSRRCFFLLASSSGSTKLYIQRPKITAPGLSTKDQINTSNFILEISFIVLSVHITSAICGRSGGAPRRNGGPATACCGVHNCFVRAGFTICLCTRRSLYIGPYK